MCGFRSDTIWHKNTKNTTSESIVEASISISILPLAAVVDSRNHRNVLSQSENGVQGAVPRVDKRELVEACTINTTVSIRQPNKTVRKEMRIILDCVLFSMNGYCRSQQCSSICTSLRDLESVTRWLHATHSTLSSVHCVTWVNKMCLVFFFFFAHTQFFLFFFLEGDKH